MKGNHAFKSWDQPGDYLGQHQRDDGEPDIRPREAQKDAASDGDRGCDEESREVEKVESDVEPSRDPPEKKVVVWIARSPTFHGEPHYEIGIDFD